MTTAERISATIRGDGVEVDIEIRSQMSVDDSVYKYAACQSAVTLPTWLVVALILLYLNEASS